MEITPDYPWNILPLKNYFHPLPRYFLECKNLLRNIFLLEYYQKYSRRSCRGSQIWNLYLFLLASHAPRKRATASDPRGSQVYTGTSRMFTSTSSQWNGPLFLGQTWLYYFCKKVVWIWTSLMILCLICVKLPDQPKYLDQNLVESEYLSLLYFWVLPTPQCMRFKVSRKACCQQMQICHLEFIDYNFTWV